MHIGVIIASVVLSLFSTSVMSYIAMATPIGPWIAPTLVLLVLLFLHLLRLRVSNQAIVYAVSAGSLGGIIATAMAFSLPTIYFLDQALFNSWMARPWYFFMLLSGLCITAGWFGVWIANVSQPVLFSRDHLSFPIGRLIARMIQAQQQVRKAYELVAGFVGTTIFCFLQDGLYAFRGIIVKSITVVPSFYWGVVHVESIRFDMWPMVWAIGFVTGHVIAVPLAIGALAQIIILGPLHALQFTHLSFTEFSLAFCSGIVVVGAAEGFFDLAKRFFSSSKKQSDQAAKKYHWFKEVPVLVWIEGVALFIVTSIFFSYMGMSLVQQVYLVAGTALCAYQMAAIAGRIGMALLGRFATFVMIPAMILFGLDYVHLVFMATFVEIAGGVATDVLFGRMSARIVGANQERVRRYQYLGLIIASLSIGVIFWLLIKSLGLGTTQLFAQKAQARRLLIDAQHFDFIVLAVGAVFGFILKKIKVNPTLVFGGLLMPLSLSLGLIVGGMATKLVKDREEWDPFWSGVFAANSLWMLVKAAIG